MTIKKKIVLWAAGIFLFLGVIGAIGSSNSSNSAVKGTTITQSPQTTISSIKSSSNSVTKIIAKPTATPTVLPTLKPLPTNTPIPTRYIAPTAYIAPTTIPATQSSTGLSNNNYYTNVDGNEVHSPADSTNGSVPAGATAQCNDGTYSFSQHHSGTCSGHNGVASWL